MPIARRQADRIAAAATGMPRRLALLAPPAPSFVGACLSAPVARAHRRGRPLTQQSTCAGRVA